jgi:hypoxanthine-DNA glycosylase
VSTPDQPSWTPPDLKRCFPPVVNDDTRLLILGSLPGDRSLEQARYYAHPQNQFWKLLGAVMRTDLVSRAYEERLKLLLEAGIGLWDVIASAQRSGSLDTHIRNAEANSLPALTAHLPRLRAIAFNGSTSARIGTAALGPEPPFALVPLPSSSPAYTLPLDRKVQAWEPLRDFLR